MYSEGTQSDGLQGMFMDTSNERNVHMFTSFLTYHTEYRTALNSGWNESFSVISEISEKILERESVKQLSTTALNSLNQGQSRQHPRIETQHMEKL